MTGTGSYLDRVISGALAIGVIAIAGVVIMREIRGGPSGGEVQVGAGPPRFVPDWEALGASGVRVYDQSAPVQLVVFADVECPFCAAFHERLERIRADRPNTVGLTVVHFPIRGHRFAVQGAVALECAARQQASAAFLTSAYELQDSIGLLSWSAIASRSGVADTGTFGACIKAGTFQSKIAAGTAAGARLKIEGTPSVLVNGWLYPGVPNDSVLRAAIDNVLSKRSVVGAN